MFKNSKRSTKLVALHAPNSCRVSRAAQGMHTEPKAQLLCTQLEVGGVEYALCLKATPQAFTPLRPFGKTETWGFKPKARAGKGAKGSFGGGKVGAVHQLFQGPWADFFP
jgi:hypothetical protein